jgi:hypothetical protein
MTEDERKYLDFLQAVISKLAENSFQLKCWSVGLASIIIGLTTNNSHAELAWVALLPALAFWALDGYYLGLERRYRDLYGRFIAGQNRPKIFNMNAGELSRADWSSAAFRKPVALIHLPIAALAVIITIWGVSVAPNTAKPDAPPVTPSPAGSAATTPSPAGAAATSPSSP